MLSRRLRLTPTAAELVHGFKRIRAAMGLPEEFSKEVLGAAEKAARRDPREGGLHRPRDDIEFITIDPPGSMDLDQAFHAMRDGEGFTVHYAIADPGWFMAPGDAVDLESRRRGQTLYAPDARVRLYPPVLSEGAASLLQGQVRPAVLWEMNLDDRAVPQSVEVTRALVASRQQLSYEQAQREIDSGNPRESLRLLAMIGRLRQRRERQRGGIHVELPEQEVIGPPGEYRLAFSGPLPVEEWNAQISLMTGMAAARLMLDGGSGLLRTMPPPETESLEQLRRNARALHREWPKDLSYQEFLRTLSPSQPRDAALMNVAMRLFRLAGYVAFDGHPPTDVNHHAIAASYSHVTAPLRRLADRFANEVALALCRGERPPAWASKALPEMPEIMKEAHRRDGELERRVVDFVETVVLQPFVGEEFDAVVVEAGKRSGTIQLTDQAVLGGCRSPGLELGAEVRVRLTEANPDKGSLHFDLVRRARP